MNKVIKGFIKEEILVEGEKLFRNVTRGRHLFQNTHKLSNTLRNFTWCSTWQSVATVTCNGDPDTNRCSFEFVNEESSAVTNGDGS